MKVVALLVRTNLSDGTGVVLRASAIEHQKERADKRLSKYVVHLAFRTHHPAISEGRD